MLYTLYLISFLVISSLYAEGATETNSLASTDEVYEFIEKNINGKELVTDERTSLTGGGKLQAVASSSAVYENLTRTPFGFYFDTKISIKATIFDLDSNGKRIGEGRIEDYRFTKRLQVSQRRSSGQLIGIEFPIDESGVLLDDGVHPFVANAVRISIAGDKLLLESQSIFHDDLFAEQGRHRPGAIESIVEYRLLDGGLIRISKAKGYDMDVKNSTKTLSDSPPPRIEYEKVN